MLNTRMFKFNIFQLCLLTQLIMLSVRVGRQPTVCCCMYQNTAESVCSLCSLLPSSKAEGE